MITWELKNELALKYKIILHEGALPTEDQPAVEARIDYPRDFPLRDYLTRGTETGDEAASALYLYCIRYLISGRPISLNGSVSIYSLGDIPDV